MIFIVFRNLILTIILEFILAFILGVRSKSDFLGILSINCVTNLLLQFIMWFVESFFSKYIFLFLVLLELLVIFGEFCFYKETLVFHKIPLVCFSILLNAFSFGLGWIILES